MRITAQGVLIITCFLALSCDVSEVPTTSVASDTTGVLSVVEADFQPDDKGAINISLALQLQNVSPDTLYLLGCNPPSPPVTEKLTTSGWSTAFNAIHAMCQDFPLAVNPNDSLNYSYHTIVQPPRHPESPFPYEWAAGDHKGTYRLHTYLHYLPCGPTVWHTNSPCRNGEVRALKIISSPFTIE